MVLPKKSPARSPVQNSNVLPVHRISMVTLSVNDLVVRYQSQGKDVQAVDHVSFSCKDNESIGIAGESGCGKSTLGLAIMKTLQGNASVAGEILLDGRSILPMPDTEFTKEIRWKKVSMVFQGAMNSLDPVFSIKEQFEEILKEHGRNSDHVKMINRAISTVGLPPNVLDKFPHELSGGMKQRIVIAMALLLGPELLIADVPT